GGRGGRSIGDACADTAAERRGSDRTVRPVSGGTSCGCSIGRGGTVGRCGDGRRCTRRCGERRHGRWRYGCWSGANVVAAGGHGCPGGAGGTCWTARVVII